MDAIDAALVRFTAGHPHLEAAISHPWPGEIRSRLRQAVEQPCLTLEALGSLDHQCGLAFADAVTTLLNRADIAALEVTAVGSHGQTLHHHPLPPHPFTLQVGDPNLIAQRTGITTVADFRRRDMAAGGQGAPLVPRFHQALFASPGRSRVVLNIGGIANITLLNKQGEVETAFDTGPGNCLMDAWCRHVWKTPYDKDGKRAASAKTDSALLKRLLEEPFYRLSPPKSTGTEHFSLNYLLQRLKPFSKLTPETVLATLLELTAVTIADAVRRWGMEAKELLVCGGGRHNLALMKALSQQLPELKVTGTDAVGTDPDWVEAMAFAWLAAAALAGQPGNLPAATGACREVVLGAIYPASGRKG